MKNRTWLIIGLVLLAFILYAVVKSFLPGLTEAHWQQVEKGMSRQQVETLLGSPERTVPADRVRRVFKEELTATTDEVSFWGKNRGRGSFPD